MGYNNNYAGIHMIRYSRYGQYDDLKYYDKLAEQERQCKKVNARPENSNNEDRKNKFKKSKKQRKHNARINCFDSKFFSAGEKSDD